jgi:hypothetical protein
MSARLAVIRLWIFGSISWIAFWIWNYATKCMRMDNAILWCPRTAGNGIRPTDYFNLAVVMFGPPLATFAVGLLCFWAIKCSRRRMG